MISAVSTLAPRLNAELLAKIPALQVPKFPPPPPPDPMATVQLAANPASLRELADGWCGTVPRHFPLPLPPKGGDDGGWCGTVPRPFPLPVPPTPPQPWLDLANAAQAFR